VVGDPLAEKGPDVVEFLVARGVHSRLLGGDEILPGPLGHDDDRMATVADPPRQVDEKAAGAVEGEGHLGDQHVVGVGLSQRRVAGDKAGVAAHQLDEAHAVGRRLGLDVGRADALGRLGEGGLEAERLVDVGNVVVDRLGDAHHRDPAASFPDPLGHLHGAPQRAVAADHEQRADVLPLEAVDDLVGILAAAGGAEDRAAIFGNPAHHLRREVHHVMAVAGNEPLVAVPEAVDPPHAVVEGELHHQTANHVVDPGTEAAAGHDPHPQLRRIEEDAPSRSGWLEAGQGGRIATGGDDLPERVVEEDAVGFLDVVLGGLPGLDPGLQRGVDPAGAE
jgi:hypothetical protein